jgi:ADP-dependent NAD(P)H-hydrate dehydratase / NAD(P)H-hydrate epimerase
MRVLNAAQMREADRRTIEEIGIPSLVLMENAGRQVVAAIEAVHDDLLEQSVAVLCGRGSNGGDGFVVARTLMQRGVDVSVFLIGRVADVRGDARTNLEILGRLGLSVVEIADSQAWELHFSEIGDCTLIIDAIFGTGLNAPLAGLMETVVADVNASGLPVVSIDLPSGLAADSHQPIGDSIEAGMTVTLAAPKLSLVLPPAETRAGVGRRTRTRAITAGCSWSPGRAGKPAQPIWQDWGRCARARDWSPWRRLRAAFPSWPHWRRST